MKVHIIGPNLIDQSKGSFHVHAEGCADVHRNTEYAAPDYAHDRAHAVEVASQLDAAEYVYSDQIGEGSMTAADGVDDLWFAPCTADLPYTVDDSPTTQWKASVTIVVDATSEQDAIEQAEAFPAESRLNWEVEPLDGDEAADDEDEHADTLVTCRECSTELPSGTPCEASEDGEHDPDMVIHEPPVDAPTRRIRVESIITVPNDGYDYHVDPGGRLERVLGRMLDDRLVSCVETAGPSGSGWAEDVRTVSPVPEGALPIGTYVRTKTHGHRGRITEAHSRCPEGPAWLMGQSVPLTGVYADGGGTWYSVLCQPAGAVVVTADDVEVVEPFQFDNPWASEHFTD